MLYPETKAETAQAIGMNKAKGNNVNCNLQSTRKSFIEDTANVTGSHPSTIARHIKIASDLTAEAKKILRGAKKSVSSTTLKKISKLPPEQQKAVSSLLVSGEIRTVDEYLAEQKQPELDTMTESELSQEQIAVMMGMAYFTDDINSNVRDLLKRKETFAKLPGEHIRYLMEMYESINKSLHCLRDMLADCY